MNPNLRNAMVIGTIGAIAGYSMIRYSRNSKKPMNRAKNMFSKAADMF